MSGAEHPGDPFAEELAAELADLEVIDGPHVGQVWTYVADLGGFVPTDDRDATPCRDTAAVIAYTGGNVRPAS